jgi:RNA polymerase sigma-70 factor (ECF subfamily)
MDDKKLLKLIREKPSEGLGEIIREYSGLLTAIVMRVLKNPQETEECVADTFISLWKNIHTVKKADSLKAYLICIARNNAIDRYRKFKNENTVSIDSIENFEIIADDDVELLVVKNEFMEELQKIIMQIPELDREIFMRKYFLFESVREIAKNLNLTEIQVKDRLYRVRKQIKKNCEMEGVFYNEIIFTSAR